MLRTPTKKFWSAVLIVVGIIVAVATGAELGEEEKKTGADSSKRDGLIGGVVAGGAVFVLGMGWWLLARSGTSIMGW